MSGPEGFILVDQRGREAAQDTTVVNVTTGRPLTTTAERAAVLVARGTHAPAPKPEEAKTDGSGPDGGTVGAAGEAGPAGDQRY